jgi:hypothetical protein
VHYTQERERERERRWPSARMASAAASERGRGHRLWTLLLYGGEEEMAGLPDQLRHRNPFVFQRLLTDIKSQNANEKQSFENKRFFLTNLHTYKVE